MNDRLISLNAALDALDKVAEMFPYRIPGKAKTYRQYNEAWSDAIDAAENALEALPSAQPGQRNARVFQGIVVEYPSISAYPEYEGKPYFSIKYTENGQEFIGYGTYKPEVLSEYLKEYFMPPTQPEWIPWDSGRFPEESGTYTVTAYDGATKRVTYAKYQKRLKRWELTGARAYWRVLAWQPLPTPYREGGQDA